MKIKVEVFLVVMPCSDVVGYQKLQGTLLPIYIPLSQSHSLHPEDRGGKVLRNAGILPHHYMASQPRRPGNQRNNDNILQHELEIYYITYRIM
jgi:hypothetical protein